ncbi:LysR substrate-binding domain-containing protein [Corticibacterium sp. UT-5YL-CI-8]|nr:LysR substrate-binding domain-containing protein [Tianweitania sp. UT-5YL-CI-8]
MDFRQIRYFLAVAEHQNFRRASEALHVAQSALSKHVLELEARLDAKLFERLAKGVRLTPAGRVFVEEARRALEAVERAESRARKAARGEIDRLTIAMNDIGARNRTVANAIRSFVETYPEVQLDFISMVSQEQITALQHGKIDAAIVIERPENPNFGYVEIANDPFWLAIPRFHRLAAKPNASISDLVGEPFVSVALSTYWLPQTRLLAQCRGLGLIPHVVQEASNDQMQMNFIAAGIGIGFVNASIVNVLATDVVLKRVEGLTVSLRLDLVWSEQSRSPSLPNFVKAIRVALLPATD